MADNPYDRPLIVTIIGILYALSAIVLLIAAVVLIIGGTAIIDEIVQENPDHPVSVQAERQAVLPEVLLNNRGLRPHLIFIPLRIDRSCPNPNARSSR